MLPEFGIHTGSFKRTNTWYRISYIYGWTEGPEEKTYVGTWDVKGNDVITMIDGNETKYTLSHDKENGKYLLAQEVPMASDFDGITYYREVTE